MRGISKNARDIKVSFKWRKISGIIGRMAGSFNDKSLRTRVLSREDRNVFSGKAKRNSEMHALISIMRPAIYSVRLQ